MRLTEELIAKYLAGELDSDLQDRVAASLAQDEDWQAAIKLLEDAEEQIALEGPTRGVWAHVMATVAPQQRGFRSMVNSNWINLGFEVHSRIYLATAVGIVLLAISFSGLSLGESLELDALWSWNSQGPGWAPLAALSISSILALYLTDRYFLRKFFGNEGD